MGKREKPLSLALQEGSSIGSLGLLRLPLTRALRKPPLHSSGAWPNLSKPPSAYLKDFYYDSVNFDPNALRLAIEFAGTGRILAGSDYPHMIGSIPSMLESIRGLQLAPEEESAILGGNAARLLGL